jgi:hypothetical protein
MPALVSSDSPRSLDYSLLQKLAHDLRTTLSPVYADLLARLLDFLPRPIATPALTALLATLSGLFRYLLVPSIHLDLLQQTWSSFHAVLPNCSPEVQRAAAEVWGSVLRRLKTSAREKAVLLMATNLDGVETASAWTLVFACKVGIVYFSHFPCTDCLPVHPVCLLDPPHDFTFDNGTGDRLLSELRKSRFTVHAFTTHTHFYHPPLQGC